MGFSCHVSSPYPQEEFRACGPSSLDAGPDGSNVPYKPEVKRARIRC
jgi:hypothetical protein